MLKNTSTSLSLLPTSGIQDQQTRNFLDRLAEAWGQLQAGGGPVKANDFSRMTGEALTGALLGRGNGNIPATEAQINSAIDNLVESIRKSVLYQTLETGINANDLLNAISNVRSGVTREVLQRENKDSSLASAINRIWASIGGSTAVIKDGELAAVTPSTAVATKWSQVVAAVTDPNTGNISSASILQETRTYASSNDSTLNALYSVRAQVTSGGQTVVGGFGLAATGGAGSAQGPSIDFGVLANKFWIGAPAAGYNPAAEYDLNNQFPFIVVTTNTTINGVTYTPGVYMKRAAIGFAAIGSAQIADASITNAKIGGSIQSDNYVQGWSGWKIGKTALYYQVVNGVSYPIMAEFNGVVMSRPNVVATGVFFPGTGQPNVFTYTSGSPSGKDGGGTPSGWSPPALVIYFDTGYVDYADVYEVTRPSFQGKAVCIAAVAGYTGVGPGVEKFYDVMVEATPISSIDHYSAGANGAIAGGRIIMKLSIPVPRNAHPSITSIQITQVKWSLLKVT